MKKYRVVILAVLIFASAMSLTLAGCGGGGGGGAAAVSTPAPTPNSGTVELTAKTAHTGDAAWGTDTTSVTSGTVQQVLADIKVANGTSGTISPSGSISIPDGSGLILVPGSVTVDYPDSASRVAGKASVSASPIERTIAEILSVKRSADRSVGRSADVADTIGSATTTLGFSLAPGQWGYLYFGLQVSANASAGSKVVTVLINGVATKVTINVVAGSTVCQAVTNPSCSANQHLVAGANDTNGCPTAGTCVANTCPTINNPSCGTGYHLVPGAADSNGCATVGNCTQDACAAVNNPTCNAGYHLVAGPVVNSCQTVGTCVADAVVTGTVYVRSNINFANIAVTCAGGQPYSHYMNPIGSGWGFDATMNVGTCSLSNTAQSGYTITSSVTTGTLTATAPLTLSLTYVASGGGGAVCGNGTVESGEQCDDHNTASGDGCSSTCQNEHIGPAEPRKAGTTK